MKISKLFHWLYAMVMFLPLFAIGITCAYVVLNENAKDSYSGSVSYSYYEQETYQTNDVVSVDDLVVGNVYSFELTTFLASNAQFDVFDYFEYVGFNFDFDYSSTDIVLKTQGASANKQLVLSFTFNQGYSFAIVTSNTTCPTNAFKYLGGASDISYTTSGNVITTIKYDFDLNILGSDYVYQTTEITTLDNVFYYAIDNLKNSSLFNWAKSSFLAQPITYITDLFGMDNDNIVIYLLSYWLDISIIWLTFDVIMYVPLLVHRWLDKGVLE